MIITLILIYSYGVILCRLFRNKRILGSSCIAAEVEVSKGLDIIYEGKSYIDDDGIKFAPPVYLQRYMVVRDTLARFGPFKKVVDLGCSELNFFIYLKDLKGTEEVLFIDQDKALLDRRCEIGVLKPLPIDYLIQREDPLVLKVLCGNASRPDVNLIDATAVVAIELIEHMFPPDLDELPYTLFGIIQPQIVIITTPNSDFNVLFNSTGFRHDDHKFEWTREQFKDWVDNLILRYPDYSSRIYGIGPGPEGTSQYGTCSQMVVFQKTTTSSVKNYVLLENAHQVISIIEYPFEKRVELSVEEEIKYDAEKFISYAVNYDEYYNYDEAQIEIPLSSIMKMLSRSTQSEELLQSVLEANKWTVKEKETGEKFVLLPSSGIPYSSSSSNELEEEEDMENNESNQDYLSKDVSCPDWVLKQNLSESSWSDTDDSVPNDTKYTLLNESGSSQKHINICDPVRTGVLKGCDNNECNCLDKSVCLKFSHSCKLNSSSVVVNSDEKHHIAGELTRCKLEPETNSTQKISEKEVSYTEFNSPDSGASNAGNKSDYLDMQVKIEKESLDVFDESIVGGPSHTFKDICSVKRSLELPLDSVKHNLNRSFETSNIQSKSSNESTSSYLLDQNESKLFRGTFKTFKEAYDSGQSEVYSAGGNSRSKSSFSTGIRGESSSLFPDCRIGKLRDPVGEVKHSTHGAGINRCLSLQHIKEKEGVGKYNRFSLCCEKENINICDIFKGGLKAKSCGHSSEEAIDVIIRGETGTNLDDSCSQSKAADSGYPNTSERDMDTDLTPEQVDELLSENDSEEEEEPVGRGGQGRVPLAGVVQLLDQVENGDVANNNRDGEGNNLDQEQLDHHLPLQFQHRVVGEGDAPLQALPPPPPPDSDSDNEDRFLSCASFATEATVVAESEDSLDYDGMRTCLDWAETSTPFHKEVSPSTAFPSHSSIPPASTSLHLPSSSSSLFNPFTQPFPPWLLSIELCISPEHINDLSPKKDFSDQDQLGIIIRGSYSGGDESHSEL